MTEGISESITVTDSDGKDTTTSTLTLSQPRKELNAVPYMCRADIEALNLPGILAKPLNQSFSLSVQCKLSWEVGGLLTEGTTYFMHHPTRRAIL